VRNDDRTDKRDGSRIWEDGGKEIKVWMGYRKG
jgi:hypothetical protein